MRTPEAEVQQRLDARVCASVPRRRPQRSQVELRVVVIRRHACDGELLECALVHREDYRDVERLENVAKGAEVRELPRVRSDLRITP